MVDMGATAGRILLEAVLLVEEGTTRLWMRMRGSCWEMMIVMMKCRGGMKVL